MPSDSDQTTSISIDNVASVSLQNPVQAVPVRIRSIEVVGVPTAQTLGTCIAIQCDSDPQIRKTSKFDGKRESSHRWLEDFQLQVQNPPSKIITFQLLRLHALRADTLYASVEFPASELHVEHDQGLSYMLWVERDVHILALIVTACSTSSPNTTKTVAEVKPVPQLLDMLKRLATKQPTAQAAWLALSAILKVTEARKNQAAINLHETIVQTYQVAMAKQTESLDQGGQFSDLFERMIRQTDEYHIFFSRYVHGRHNSQVVDQALVEVQKFKRAFNDLRQAFDDTEAKFTLASVLEERHGMKMIEMDSKLQRLKPSRRSPIPEISCSQGSRLQSLLYIRNWAIEGEESIMWLSGITGSGKSSLMGTLYETARRMGHTNRLGAYIRFDRAGYTDPSVFVRELACQLAEFDERIGQVIATVLQQSSRVPVELLAQFKEYIVKPLQSVPEVHDEGPIFILVDALGECARGSADRDFRAQLLQLLQAADSLRMFPFLRIIVASSPDEDIDEAFRGREHVRPYRLDTDSPGTRGDIEDFFTNKLAEGSSGFSRLSDEAKSRAIRLLSERASGLFLWAATVARFVIENVDSRLDAFLNTKAPKNAHEALHILYQTALDILVDEHDEEVTEEKIRGVLGLILASRRCDSRSAGPPITSIVLESLVENYGVGASSGPSHNRPPVLFNVQPVVHKLKGILMDEDGDLLLMHKSFDHFLTQGGSASNIPTWFIDVKVHIADMAYATISCALAHIENPDYKAIEIPPDFKYATCRWPMYFYALGPAQVLASMFLNPLQNMFETCLIRWIYTLQHSLRNSPPDMLIDSTSGFASFLVHCNFQGQHDNLQRLINDAWFLVDDTDPSSPPLFQMDKAFESLCRKHARYLGESKFNGKPVMDHEIDNTYATVFVQMAGESQTYEEILKVLRKECPIPPIVSLKPGNSRIIIRASERLDI
ncbi:nacht and wd40 domain protein [Moniliophthora roreri MCA 2997]|uniref:Nacht and wd40 domain protein n=1 Tax=Moniliophthora roreri (strain MCA 2997) TaxID=1381753 RepID=V2XUU7_MONRO|nr:nacht and wd40 domain protein [Moniliophthora roreri MCA 2997]